MEPEGAGAGAPAAAGPGDPRGPRARALAGGRDPLPPGAARRVRARAAGGGRGHRRGGGRGAGAALGRAGDADRRSAPTSRTIFPTTPRNGRTARPPTASSPWTARCSPARPAAPCRSTACWRRRGGAAWCRELLDLRNSADTAGDPSRVVGYGAFAFHERGVRPLDRPSAGRILLRIARAEPRRGPRALGDGIRDGCDDPWLREPGATFVTLRAAGSCAAAWARSGPTGRCSTTSRANARAAAFHDTRFPPVDPGSCARDLDRGLAALAAGAAPLRRARRRRSPCLRPGIDGVIFECDESPQHLPAPGLGAAPGSARVPGPPQAQGRAAARLLGAGGPTQPL